MSSNGAVDSGGKITGMSSVRICDASAFPSVPRANTHLTVVAAAEIFSDKIINDYNNSFCVDKCIVRLNAQPQFHNEVAALILNEWPSENDNENDQAKLASQILNGDIKGLDHTGSNFMITWVCIDKIENELAGTIRFCSHDMEGYDEKFGNCWIAALYVKEKYRKQNIGKHLVQTVRQYKESKYIADDGKNKHIHLWFPSSKPYLLNFYQSSGFAVFNDGLKFDKSSFGEDVIVMRECNS
jgi:GNAT superfamily N-acetyltransferase